ncbi:ribosomal protein S5 domain 2-type protein [Endogone sp. FLAS-F59071]|nr:ribosomal protein S5 domain 2-type protein [Endogone sp. FLAS-F59071]|eukprot:RUS23065.1 ribosomal protein S5 domain 2-type protein [Endogone sp. FLAS-F59071]
MLTPDEETAYQIPWDRINDACHTATVSYETMPKVAPNRWVVSKAPARIDFAGGWTDTPPITYEHGGKVVNIAIKCPLGAKARRISRPEILLSVSSSFEHRNETHHRVICMKPSDFDDHADPHIPCALLKACVVYTGIIDPPKQSTRTLKEMLEATFDDGLDAPGIELHAWSSLPQGTGLGSSSILAGTILAALGTLVGRKYDTQSLVHAVLQVEQIFTTGGGWQDQIGGFLPNVKFSASEASLPLRVTWSTVDLPTGFLDLLESRLLLVYTGHSRLAKNLLRNVVSHWERRSEEVVRTFDALVSEAEEQAEAFRQGSLPAIGRLLTSYFAHKRHLNSTTLNHPPVLTPLLKLVDPYAYGYALAGAGGGGFLAIVLREEVDRDKLTAEIRRQFGQDEEVVWDVHIDRVGLTIESEEADVDEGREIKG